MATEIEGLEDWVFDSLQKNQKLKDLFKEAGGTQDLLMLSKFMPLTDPATGYTYPDSNVFDFTNKARTGGGEDKTFADAVGSLTGAEVFKKKKLDNSFPNCSICGDVMSIELMENLLIQECKNKNCERFRHVARSVPRYKWEWFVNEGLYHLWKQVIKMYSTGLPWCIIVYGSRYVFQKKSGVSDDLILQAILKLVSLCTVYKGTVYTSIKNEKEAFECMKTFLRKSPEQPRRWPIYNLFKKVEEDQVAMHCGITGIEIVKARAIAEAGHRPCDIGYDAKRVELKEIKIDDFLKKYGKDKDTKIEGFREKTANKLFKAYTDKWSEE